jgi:hypothetical protein
MEDSKTLNLVEIEVNQEAFERTSPGFREASILMRRMIRMKQIRFGGRCLSKLRLYYAVMKDYTSISNLKTFI